MIHSGQLHPDVQHKLQFSVPNLEVLQFHPQSYSSNMEAIQPSLFGGHIPKLKSLDSTGIRSWSSGLFHDLVEMNLCTEPSQPVKESLFLEVLQASPGLKKLKVTGIGPEEDTAGKFRPIPLPVLRNLWIQYSNSRLILSRLILPASVAVVLRDCIDTEGEEDGAGGNDEHEKLTALASLPEQCSDLHFLDNISRLKITFEADAFIMVMSNQYADVMIEQNTNVLRSAEQDSFPLRSWEAVTEYAAFYSITSLDLIRKSSHYSHVLDLSEYDWATWFEHLTNLKQLAVRIGDNQNFLRALSGSKGRVPCPQLVGVELSVNELQPGNGWGRLVVDPSELQRVIDFAKARVNAGHKLERLNLKGQLQESKRQDYWKQSLEQLVKYVQVF